MSDEILINQWYFWLIIAGILVMVAAILLILIILYARRILKLALDVLGIVVEIKENTNPVWELKNTNDTALKILDRTKAINNHIHLVADALPKKNHN